MNCSKNVVSQAWNCRRGDDADLYVYPMMIHLEFLAVMLRKAYMPVITKKPSP